MLGRSPQRRSTNTSTLQRQFSAAEAVAGNTPVLARRNTILNSTEMSSPISVKATYGQGGATSQHQSSISGDGPAATEAPPPHFCSPSGIAAVVPRGRVPPPAGIAPAKVLPAGIIPVNGLSSPSTPGIPLGGGRASVPHPGIGLTRRDSHPGIAPGLHGFSPRSRLSSKSLLVAVADEAELAAEAIKDPAERLFAEAEVCLCIYKKCIQRVNIHTHAHTHICI